jgi:hypothetical protein
MPSQNSEDSFNGHRRELESEKKIVIDFELTVDESTSQISWLHSIKTFRTTAEMTLVDPLHESLISPDLNQLCEGLKNL